jgi:CHASE3 domain sensor protein
MMTRADRENARKAAASANASDLARAGKIALVVVVVAVLVLAAFVATPVR